MGLVGSTLDREDMIQDDFHSGLFGTEAFDGHSGPKGSTFGQGRHNPDYFHSGLLGTESFA